MSTSATPVSVAVSLDSFFSNDPVGDSDTFNTLGAITGSLIDIINIYGTLLRDISNASDAAWYKFFDMSIAEQEAADMNIFVDDWECEGGFIDNFDKVAVAGFHHQLDTLDNQIHQISSTLDTIRAKPNKYDSRWTCLTGIRDNIIKSASSLISDAEHLRCQALEYLDRIDAAIEYFRVPELQYFAATVPFECPICCDDNIIGDAWTCSTCHNTFCRACMEHWTGSNIEFQVPNNDGGDQVVLNTGEHHRTCPMCRAALTS
jgi:hypothetical protein